MLGIRDQINKTMKEGDPESGFRATFEDKILLIDIVLNKTKYKVDIPRFPKTPNTCITVN